MYKKYTSRTIIISTGMSYIVNANIHWLDNIHAMITAVLMYKTKAWLLANTSITVFPVLQVKASLYSPFVLSW